MTIRRLLTSLASHPPSSTSAPAVSRLVPPYHHTHNPTTPSTLRPPYSYSASPPQGLPLGAHEIRGRSLKARVNYEIMQQEGRADGWTQWAEEVLRDEGKRAEIEQLWAETLTGLESVKASGNQVPQIAFHSLASHLASESIVDAIRHTGAVVVRDVVPDAEAVAWAKQALQAINDVDGRSIYWHPALLSARANPSIISATAQVARSLLPTEEIYLQADTIREGIAPLRTTPSSTSNPWDAPRALLAHLALTPTLPGSVITGATETRLPPTVHAATYALLRPLFRAAKSKISFYNSADYFAPSNWLLSPASTSTPSPAPDYPHLAGTEVSLPQLAPGDLILHHTALPLSTQPAGQVFLPVHPVEKRGNEQWVIKQREAFESGLPPPGVGEGGEGLYVREARGEQCDIPSKAGREVMGY
ncbi:hypothetical protein IAR50_007569 [Cryptococcus sp. DSM 104548]